MNQVSWKNIVPIFYLIVIVIFFIAEAQLLGLTTQRLIGIVTTLASSIFWIVARFEMHDSFTIGPEARRLVTSGIHKKIRHPVYIFSTLVLLGIILFIGNPYLLIIIPLLVAMQIARATMEEKVLADRFGDDWLRYKKGTWF